MSDLSLFCCQNSECDHYGKRNLNNLSVSYRYGKNKQIRLLRCCTCKFRFSENKGTPYFNSRLPKEEVTNIMAHLREGNGIRRTSRLAKHSKDTVLRYSALAGKHALNLHDELVAISP
jgi:LacI family transcriptional regulator